jgi:hypothetical protein
MNPLLPIGWSNFQTMQILMGTRDIASYFSVIVHPFG